MLPSGPGFAAWCETEGRLPPNVLSTLFLAFLKLLLIVAPRKDLSTVLARYKILTQIIKISVAQSYAKISPFDVMLLPFKHQEKASKCGHTRLTISWLITSSFIDKTMKGTIYSIVNFIFLIATVGGTSSYNMLTNQIICGYQGWFTYPGDGAPINKWKHWFHDPAATVTAPKADYITVDMYPTTDEYDEDDLHESGIMLSDGSSAKFFSNVRPKVVLKHFEWMATYGISGVFNMRFMESMHVDKNREWKTIVLRNVRNAAELTGRIFAVSYNIAGDDFGGSNVLEDLKVDWMRLVDEEGITKSSSYIHQNGLPVLRIYGIGFKDHNVVHNTDEMARLISWFQSEAEEKYRVFLIGGVPSMWRNLTGDSMQEDAWKGIYDSLDGIHPWHVGRFKNITGFEHYYTKIIREDAAYCETKGILYMPTMVSSSEN